LFSSLPFGILPYGKTTKHRLKGGHFSLRENGQFMKKILCVLFSAIILIGVMPLKGFAEEKETVTIYSNKISVNAKQICFVGGSKDRSRPELYDDSFKKYYYVGDSEIDFKLIAKKLPKLQNLVIIQSGIKNPSSLKSLKDLVWLGIHNCWDTTDISFLNELPQLRKFRFSGNGVNDVESIEPIANLKNLTELYLDIHYMTVNDISSFKTLTKLGKLTLNIAELSDASVLKNFKDLKELEIEQWGRADLDLGFINELTKLESFSVAGAAGNTSGLEKMTELEALTELSLSYLHSGIDVSFVGDMTRLEKLSVCGADSFDTKLIKKLTNLKELSLTPFNTDKLDLSFLPKLKKLESLFLMACDIGKLEGITKCPELRELTIWNCSHGNLSRLKKCEKLSKLQIYGTTYFDGKAWFDIAWIEGLPLREFTASAAVLGNAEKITTLTELETLTLEYTDVSDETIEIIKKALPECKIKYRG